MKRRNKIIAAIIALNMVSAIASSPIATKAETNYKDVESSVSLALSEKSFYYYNMAYAKILALPEGAQKTELLSKLSAIGSTVWTKDISEIVNLFEVMAKEKSGREYDALQTKIKDSTIKEVDKQYLYSELYSWGTDTVWTDDYKKAIAAVVKVWTEKTEVSSVNAEKAIAELKVQANKEYLAELLTEAKVAVGLAPLTLDGKYFTASKNAYVGEGKSVAIDLSKDTTARTVTLKGKIKDLSINAPLGTVVLEDVELNEINLIDVAADTLLLKGKTTVQKLNVNDKSDNAHVVLEGKATVVAAEVKSGAKIEVRTDADVKAPIAKLAVSPETKKIVELAGDFKESVVQIQKAVELKVAAILAKVEVAKEAKDSVVTLAKDAKVTEVNSAAAIKVDGQGSVGKVTGDASGQVTNNTSGSTTTGGGGGYTGGGGGYSLPTPDAPKVTADDANNVIVGITDKMEYAIGDSTTYTSYSSSTKLDLAGVKKIRVRVKAVDGISYASTDTVIYFTENKYTLEVTYSGTTKTVGTNLSDMTVEGLFNNTLKGLNLISGISTDATEKLNGILSKMENVNVSGAKTNLLSYVRISILAKNPSSELATYLKIGEAGNLINYLSEKEFQGIYDTVNSTTGGDFAVPKFGANLQLIVSGENGTQTYVEGDKVSLSLLENTLGINKDTKISELVKKNFSIKAVYGTSRDNSYEVTAVNGVLTIKTANNTVYSLRITTK